MVQDHHQRWINRRFQSRRSLPPVDGRLLDENGRDFTWSNATIYPRADEGMLLRVWWNPEDHNNASRIFADESGEMAHLCMRHLAVRSLDGTRYHMHGCSLSSFSFDRPTSGDPGKSVWFNVQYITLDISGESTDPSCVREMYSNFDGSRSFFGERHNGPQGTQTKGLPRGITLMPYSKNIQYPHLTGIITQDNSGLSPVQHLAVHDSLRRLVGISMGNRSQFFDEFTMAPLGKDQEPGGSLHFIPSPDMMPEWSRYGGVPSVMFTHRDLGEPGLQRWINLWERYQSSLQLVDSLMTPLSIYTNPPREAETQALLAGVSLDHLYNQMARDGRSIEKEAVQSACREPEDTGLRVGTRERTFWSKVLYIASTVPRIQGVSYDTWAESMAQSYNGTKHHENYGMITTLRKQVDVQIFLLVIRMWVAQRVGVSNEVIEKSCSRWTMERIVHGVYNSNYSYLPWSHLEPLSQYAFNEDREIRKWRRHISINKPSKPKGQKGNRNNKNARSVKRKDA